MPSFRGGGAERVFIDLAEGLADKGFNVDLVVINDEGPYRDSVNPKVNVICIFGRSASRSVFKLQRYIKGCGSTTIFSCLTHLNIIVLIASQLARFKGRIVVTEHNHYSLEKAGLPSRKAFLLKLCAKYLYPLAENVIAVSEGVADDLSVSLDLDRDSLQVIYNPIDSSRIRTLSECIPLNISPIVNELFSKRYLIGIGRLVKQKRYDLMIKAFRQVRSRDKNIILVILGDGPQKNQLMKLIEDEQLNDCVYLLGFIDNPFCFLAAAEALVLSSDFEGFGNVIAEALVLGVPVISTDCPSGPNEILMGGQFGTLVKLDNPDSLAAAMVAVLEENRFQKNELIERGNEFDKVVAVEQYEKLCRG